MLSLLPAVLLHLSLGSNLRSIVAAGYVLSIAAAAMHVWHGRQYALIVIPLGFGILTAIAVAILALRNAPRARGETSRILGAMCLFLFAISFAHFRSESAQRRLSRAKLDHSHHAGIPLALFVLLQDYRFVMLDAFVRFLAICSSSPRRSPSSSSRTGLKLLLVETHSVPNPLYEALWLTSLCLVLIVFALLRGRSRLQAVAHRRGLPPSEYRTRTATDIRTPAPLPMGRMRTLLDCVSLHL